MAKTRCVVMAWSLIILAVVPLAYAYGNDSGNIDHRHFDFRNDFGSHRYRNNTGHNITAIANVSISGNASTIVDSGEKAAEIKNETVNGNFTNESVNESLPAIAAVPVILPNMYTEENGDEPGQYTGNQGIVSQVSPQLDEQINGTAFLQKKGLPTPVEPKIQSPPEQGEDQWFSMNLENHSEENESQDAIIQDTPAPKAREPLLNRMWHWLSKFGRRE